MIYNLKTNDNVTPVSVGEKAQFSFQVKDITPVFYSVTVTCGDKSVYETGKLPFGATQTPCKAKLAPTTRYNWTVTVEDAEGKTETATSYFETALLNGFDKSAKWINTGARVVNAKTPAGNPAYLLKKKFTLDKVPASARLYYCPLGAGEAYINGKRVGDGILSPAYTRYDKRALYLCEEVEPFLQEGENTICVILGDGFYNQTIDDDWSFKHATWRDASRLLLQLNADGAPIVVSDNTWLCSDKGPIVYNAIRNGEFYDARKEMDWMGATEPEGMFWKAAVATPIGGILLPMEMPEIKVMNEIKPVSITKTPSGKWLFDFGVVLVGFCRLKMAGKAGQTVKLVHAEKLKDGEVNTAELATYICTDVHQTDKYTFKDENPVEWNARFTYYGFRYVEMSGVEEEPSLDSLTALQIYTSFDQIGSFTSSDPILNKIYEIGERSFVGNYHGIPTDCPHREKNGWTGDTQLSAEQALMNFDVASSYKKFIRDFKDTQRESGQISCIVPNSYWGYNWGFGPAWDSCYFILPYLIKRYRGDNSLYADIYDSAKHYLEDFVSYYDSGNLVSFGLGDWCFPGNAPEGYNQVATLKLTDSTYYYLMNRIMADMAKDLRKYADAKKFNAKAEDIKAAIVKEFVNEETGEVDNNSQTSLACVIFHNLVSRKVGKKIARRLAASVKKAGYHYYAGVLGCKYIFSALSEYGYTDVAYKAIVNPDYPSYANWIARGATTMWEDWNDGFSRNHHMYSDVIGWMYKYLAGIKTDEKNPGYRRFFVEPKVIDDLSYVQAETESPFGKIVAGWKKENGTLTVTVTVPYGTTAVLTMPSGAKKELAAGTYTETCSL
ncbi:MAG: family 78 glycoside hydrolase catalytic domain [Clostridia bacterium]|nr:family 78 glycoside hydrolase catalytic domain [Clostridia bacterium]